MTMHPQIRRRFALHKSSFSALLRRAGNSFSQITAWYHQLSLPTLHQLHVADQTTGNCCSQEYRIQNRGLHQIVSSRSTPSSQFSTLPFLRASPSLRVSPVDLLKASLFASARRSLFAELLGIVK